MAHVLDYVPQVAQANAKTVAALTVREDAVAVAKAVVKVAAPNNAAVIVPNNVLEDVVATVVEVAEHSVLGIVLLDVMKHVLQVVREVVLMPVVSDAPQAAVIYAAVNVLTDAVILVEDTALEHVR